MDTKNVLFLRPKKKIISIFQNTQRAVLKICRTVEIPA